MSDPLNQLRGFIRDGSPEAALVGAIDFDRLPRHIAIIMDGNGRWARQRSLPRVAGHRAGIAAVRDVVETSARIGCEFLTLYAFSVENWKRPRAEVSTLMALLREYLRKELKTLLEHDIAFNVIGRIEELSEPVRRDLEETRAQPRDNRGMLFNIALSDGGRTEIVDACNRLLRERGAGGAREGAAPDGAAADEPIDEATFERYLYTAGQPDPDLLIRTSGELRISNFLLWQIAYSEIWVTETLWPDFRRGELLQAIIDYQKRERRYGRVEPGGRPVAASTRAGS
ncbi:MAG TPA: isoprenyl transferase [Candidatus Polarisedimenticolia bacterium]|nr:isoprenyl transferase [Candidatus Polarisedimenticolia bacterium]